MVQSFQELEVYRRAYKIALQVHQVSLTFPKIEQFALADQVRRASKSICANIAEGFARNNRSAVEFKRFLTIALGSSDEMLVWSEFCRDLKYIDNQQSTFWIKEYGELSRMIHALKKNWKTNR